MDNSEVERTVNVMKPMLQYNVKAVDYFRQAVKPWVAEAL